MYYFDKTKSDNRVTFGLWEYIYTGFTQLREKNDDVLKF